jgi:phage terminase Nu1 subunit (DNA packaging protein)
MPRQVRTAGLIVNREELAGILGCAPTTVDRYIRAGCPIIEHGTTSQGHRVNTADVVRWLREREAAAPAGDSQSDARRRHMAASAELKELALAEKRGQMIRVDDVATILADELANVRSRLMAMPGRLAPTVAAMSDIFACEKAMTDEVAAALSELSSQG